MGNCTTNIQKENTDQYSPILQTNTNKEKSNHSIAVAPQNKENTINFDILSESIDLKLFEQNEQRKCICFSDCSHLLRIMSSLKYYQLLISPSSLSSSSYKGRSGRDVFIQFCDEIYSTQCLEDYIHFICEHSNDINKIIDGLESKCNNINECEWTQRHFRNRNYSQKENEKDEYNFYIDIMDTIHFYLYHMEDMGLRVTNNNDIKSDDDDDNDGYLNCYDQQIDKIQKQIQLKKSKCNLQINRLNNTNNSKFNIMTNNNNQQQQFHGDDDVKLDQYEDNKNDGDNNKNNKKAKKGSNNIWKKAQNAMNKYFGNNKKGTNISIIQPFIF